MMTRTMRRNYVTYKGVKRMNYAIKEKEREMGYSKKSSYREPMHKDSDLSKGIDAILFLFFIMFLLGMGWI